MYVLTDDLEGWYPVMQHRLRLAMACVVAGSLLAYFALSRGEKTKHLGSGPEKFIPAQTLQLVDIAGAQIASLFLAPDGAISFDLNDAAGEMFAHYGYTGNVKGLMLSGSSRPKESSRVGSIHMLMDSEPSFTLHTPDGKNYDTYSKGFHQSSGTLETIQWFGKELAKGAYHKVVPEKPENTIESIIPSEDLRLVDGSGHVFGVLGLSLGGEPSLLLLDLQMKPMVVWSLTTAGPLDSGPPGWSILQLFDDRGTMRVMAELGPDLDPLLTIYEKTDRADPLGIYVLDPDTGKEVPRQKLFAGRAGAIPWLRHRMLKANLPVTLTDERNQVLWRSPT